jgi:DNA-binding transcriptional LysR family regulator
MASRVMFAAEMKRGVLLPVLPGYALKPVEVHALFPGGPRPSAKVRAFVDFLAEELEKPMTTRAKR